MVEFYQKLYQGVVPTMNGIFHVQRALTHSPQPLRSNVNTKGAHASGRSLKRVRLVRRQEVQRERFILPHLRPIQFDTAAFDSHAKIGLLVRVSRNLNVWRVIKL